MNLKNNLLELRKKINILDKKILILLSERRNIASQIAKKKIIYNYPIRDKNREKELLNTLSNIGKIKYSLSKNYIKKIFQIIIEDSIIIQNKIKNNNSDKHDYKKTKFSFLGPKGSYSYIALIKYATKYFKNFIEIEYNNFIQVLQSVEKNESDYAIVPIENTDSGFIDEIYNLLITTNLYIIGELNIPIQHCLLTIPETKIENINTVYSHPQPFYQCSKFIKKFPHWNIKYTNSTSDAIKKISKIKKNNIAAIGNKETGKKYQLINIKNNLTNHLNNSTRFIILSNKNIQIPQNILTKIIIFLKIKKKYGILSYILLIFKKNYIKIIKIVPQSQNTIKNSKEIFYIEIQENSHSKNIKKVLKILQKKKILIKILGYYPI